MDGQLITQRPPLPYVVEHTVESIESIISKQRLAADQQLDKSKELFAQLAGSGTLNHNKEFFELMRRFELVYNQWDEQNNEKNSEHKRFKPSWLELNQAPDLDFATAEVKSVEWLSSTRISLGEPRLSVEFRHFGLFAPYGPMPIHLTDHAIYEKAFAAFLNFITAQVTWLHYVSRVSLHPLLGLERGEDSFGAALMHMTDSHFEDDVTAKAALDCHLKYPGIYASPIRTFRQLQVVLEGYFNVPIRLDKNIGRWINVSDQHLSAPTVGSWRLGRRFWDVQSAISIVIGPIEGSKYGLWKRRSKRLLALLAVVQDFVGARVDPIVSVLLSGGTDMKMTLGTSRVGQDSWCCTKKMDLCVKVCDLT